MRRARALATALSMALGLGGCGPEIEAELPDVVITQHEILIPAAPAAVSAREPALTIPFERRQDGIGLPREASQVTVRELILAAKEPSLDLAFIRSLRVTIADSRRPGVKTEIARYERPSAARVGPVLVIPRDPPVDVSEAFRADASLIELEVTGALPTLAWSLDVGFRAAARLSY
jgi:hypothetical protein